MMQRDTHFTVADAPSHARTAPSPNPLQPHRLKAEAASRFPARVATMEAGTHWQTPRPSALSRVVPPEEVVNAITHGVGLLLSVAGALVLVGRAWAAGDAWRVAGCSVFAATLIAVYAASTLSHSFSRPDLRRLFRRLDQGCIYLLIVGTYTPFSLAFLRGGWWLLLGLLWAVALGGLISKILFSHRVEAVAVWIYLLLGWMPVVSIGALIALLPAAAVWWMVAGGLCYTFGTVFLVNDTRIPYLHPVWHLMVIAGSACHFFSILRFVAGMA